MFFQSVLPVEQIPCWFCEPYCSLAYSLSILFCVLIFVSLEAIHFNHKKKQIQSKEEMYKASLVRREKLVLNFPLMGSFTESMFTWINQKGIINITCYTSHLKEIRDPLCDKKRTELGEQWGQCHGSKWHQSESLLLLFIRNPMKEMLSVHCNIQNCDFFSASSVHLCCPVD